MVSKHGITDSVMIVKLLNKERTMMNKHSRCARVFRHSEDYERHVCTNYKRCGGTCRPANSQRLDKFGKIIKNKDQNHDTND